MSKGSTGVPSSAGGGKYLLWIWPLVVHRRRRPVANLGSRRSDSSHKLVPTASVQPLISSSRASEYTRETLRRGACPALNAREIVLSTGPPCCGVCKIVAVVHEQTVRVLSLVVWAESRGSPISATKRLATARMPDALSLESCTASAAMGHCPRTF